MRANGSDHQWREARPLWSTVTHLSADPHVVAVAASESIPCHRTNSACIDRARAYSQVEMATDRGT